MKARALVRVVDDDEAVRNSLKYMLEQAGWACETYCGSEDFLARDITSIPGCLVLDVQMGRMSGPALQRELNRRGCTLPVIFFSGHGSLGMAVDTMRRGAAHFIEKSAGPETVLQAVSEAMACTTEAVSIRPAEIMARFSSLTEQEQQTALLVAEGRLNADIARELGISAKTVRNYKVQIRQKLQLQTPAEITLFIARVKKIAAGESHG